MKYVVIFIVLTTFFLQKNYAQLQADNWVFRSGTYVSFNGASNPSSVNLTNNNFIGGAGTSSYSDENGNLLFTVCGDYVYDKNFNVFPSLVGFNNELMAVDVGQFSTSDYSQPNLIIPYPGNSKKFIIFHIYSQFSNQFHSELHYSVVNMNLRNGLGEIEPGMKNILLLNGQEVNLQMSATLHCNKKDIWFVGHYLNSDKFFSLLVNNIAVVNTPIEFSGYLTPFFYIQGANTYYNKFGCLKISPYGDKLAAAHLGLNFTELLDFNISTGIGSNVKKIVTKPNPNDTVTAPGNFFDTGPYGVEFSASNEFLYVGSRYSELGYGLSDYYFFQYNINFPTEALIQASQYYYGFVQDITFGAMQLANNGKLYINANDNLVEIAKPNLYGAASQYNGIVNYANLTVPVYSYNLPNFLQSYFRYPTIAAGNCQSQTMNFSIQNPIGVSSIAWDFGDPASGANNTSALNNPSHTFSTQGSYMVKAVLQNSNGCGADTVRKIVYAGQLNLFLGNDTTYCQGDSMYLKMNIPYGHNQWSNGTNDTILKITQPGTYWVTVRIGECAASDTIVITQSALPQFTLGVDTVICNNATITLAPNPNYNNSTYLWSNATLTPTNTVTTAGVYWLQVTNNKGCIWRDSVNITYKTLPNFNLGNDMAICQKDTIILNATVQNATSYTWNTGATTPTIKAFATNTYWCDVNKEGCVYRDSMNLLVKPLPMVNLGNDTTICEDKTYTLNATNTGATYAWQDASTNPIYTVTNAGTYAVKVNLNGCIANDTTVVQYQLKPKFTLGVDKLICPGLTITLDPKLTTTGLQYLWQDGTTLTTYNATQQGLYYVDISNYCGDTRDSITITKGLCKVYVPTAFTPNNDNVNDVFKVGGGEAVTNFTLTIYNRWGTKIFSTNNIQESWNGTVQNKPQPTGAYIYQVEYKDVTTNEIFRMKGTVVLIR